MTVLIRRLNGVSLFLLFCCVTPAWAANDKAAIASAHPLATLAGFEILEQGGNAFDAAVAVSAALAVVEPAGSGLGGGGFWLLHREKDGFETMVDGREKAPLAAHKNMYLDQNGEVIPGLSRDGALAAGIPGLPAALVHLSENYGALPLPQVLRPAMRYAEQGFQIGERHRKLLAFRLKQLLKDAAASEVLLQNGRIPDAGSVLRQSDLAKTLSRLAEQGRDGFYAGEVAEKLLASVKQGGGIWTQDDLDQYKVVERRPIRGNYRGIDVVSAAPPSSGGIVMLQALNILSAYSLDELDRVGRIHLVSAAMQRAYHDRAMFLGDADFVEIPQAQLLSLDYAAGIRRSIRLDKAMPSTWLAGEIEENNDGPHTTHFSIIDKDGNRVAGTLSVNFPFGAAAMAEGTGVLLNDEMDDFVSKAGSMNGYGLVGGVANAIEPGKRMLSSMSPTFLEDDERIAVVGTPGGSRIISMVLLAVLDFAAGHEPDSWVNVPRYHHQYLPDVIQYEKGGLTEEEIAGLKALGHRLKEVRYRYGNMQAVQYHKKTGRLSAASDPRGEGLALVR
ncbi:gamma-glutamyltransferase [Methylomarinum vadi]|uniref:gamma-glutamyltransferase n=1 Tax=Methylomarinum vadi TaxID=438855 RepID=UPI000565E339|nr:gamma-glutamyltransferase [Methylomarinum vadi]